MKIAIVILVTRTKMLLNVLKQLTRQTYDHRKIKIVLVLSDDCHVTLPHTDIKIVQVIENNLHLCVRRNKGVEQAQDEVIAFLDDDVILPLNWVEVAIDSLKDTDCDGVCGPVTHFDRNAPLSYQLSGAATDSVFLEGFEDTWADKIKRVHFYNMPGCNCAIKRNVWEQVGRFNETMYPYMDDIEFFYIASRLGFTFSVVPSLAVSHKVEPFPLRYLKKKMITRFHTGINTILFHEIFLTIPYIKLAFILYGILIGLCLFYQHIIVLFGVLLSTYLLVSITYALKFYKKYPRVFFLLPITFLATHITNFIAFTGGIMFALGFRRKFHPIVAIKIKRFEKCLN